MPLLYRAFCSVSNERRTKEAVSVLIRYSPVNQLERTCYYLVGARTAGLARAVRATVSALHGACSLTLAVKVVPPHTGEEYPAVSSVLLCGLARTVRATLPALRCACCSHLSGEGGAAPYW